MTKKSVEPQSNKLSLTLDGAITTHQFLRAVESFFRVLNNVANKATNTNDAFTWMVRVREGSAIIEAQPSPRNASLDQIPIAISAIEEGVSSLEAGSSERPKFFDDASMKALKELSQVTENDISVKIKVGSKKTIAKLSAKTIASVNSVLEAIYTDYGTIEGKLETVSKRNGYQFTLYDDLTDHAVKCHFDSSMLRRVLDVFENRVSVRGTIRYRKDGVPVSIQVEDFRILRKSNELPGIEKIVGILRTQS